VLTHLDHVRLELPDADAAADYRTLVGRRCDSTGAALDLPLTRGGLVLAGAIRQRVAIVFGTGDLAAVERALTERGLPWSRDGELLRLDPSATRQVDLRVMERAPRPAAPLADGVEPSSAVERIDHVVVATPASDEAAELYGQVLGIRLGAESEQFGMRLRFFRVGGVTVELASKQGMAPAPHLPDSIWGLSWGVPDIAAAHLRLADAGFELSEIRVGRRPGTDVFTVRAPTHGVRTVVIGPARGET
jgi:catechol 2,3-dioxygenase-like lactoylglutathione lyase family enzyme